MSKRIFFSFCAFIFSVTTCGAAMAQAAPAASGPNAVTAPVSFELKDDEQIVSDALKPQPFQLQSKAKQDLSSEEAVRHALREYDISVRDDSLAANGKRIYGPRESVSGSPNPSRNSLRFDRRDDSSLLESGDYSPFDSDRLSNDARRQISTQRQRTADRIADMIAPGFGRAEFDVGDNHVRVDYIYSRRCKTRGIGVCFQMTFR